MSDPKKTKQAEQAQPKRALILSAALEILMERGDAALTMRQVAQATDMRLSNVQYYFKDRGTLLTAMADLYFEDCLNLIRSHMAEPKRGAPEDQLRALISFYLSHVETLTDMCRLFRELWAIATRDAEVAQHMKSYYQNLIVVMEEACTQILGNQVQSQRVVALLVPFFEGYSITNVASSQNTEDIADMLVQAVLKGSGP